MTTLEAVDQKLISGKYRVVAPLGQGAMGVVYRAEQLDIENHVLREVALKTLRSELSRDPDFSRRFLREVRVAARLRNPHTVTVYDSGLDNDGQLFYTMEIIHGRTLKEEMQSGGPMPVARAVRLVSHICEALGEAHGLSEPIVHRDIKPANIFLEQQQEEEWVKVGDFGIAKVLGEETSGLSHTGVSPGTPRYMSPEQWMGKDIDGRADLYALGVMLYEMLTGESPFVTSDGAMGLMYQHLHNAPRPLPLTIPAGVRLQIERMLAKAPQDRPASPALVRRALEAALSASDDQYTLILRSDADSAGQTTVAPTLMRESAPAPATHAQRKDSTVSESLPASSRVIPGERPRVRRGILGGLSLFLLVGGGVWYHYRQQHPPPTQSLNQIEVTSPAPDARRAASERPGSSSQRPSGADTAGTDLILAARSGSIDLVRALVEKGADVNAKDNKGRTALMWASGNGDVALVKTLLESGAAIDQKDDDGKTALLWATSRPLDRFALVQTIADTVQVLLANGADLTASDTEGKSPLMWAIANGYDIVVRVLLAKGVPLNIQDKNGNSALLLAAKNDRIEAVRLLLTRSALINLQNAEGMTALMTAANAGYLNIINALLTKNADLNLKDNEGRTALMWAVNSSSPDIVQALLAKGADPTLINKGGRNAVMIAAIKGQAGILKSLLTKEVDINATDENGKTALMWAAIEGHLDCVETLLAKGAALHVTDKGGKSALLWAIAQDYVDPEIEQIRAEIVQALLTKGADIRQKSDDGRTALLWAAVEGRTNIVQTLLAKRADLQIKDRSGKTALMLASEGNHPEIVNLLRAAGAQE